MLSILAEYLATVYDAQSAGFDLKEADQNQIDIEKTINPKKGGISSQGFGLTAEEKKAVELHAMSITTDWLKNNGYKTTDTSANNPFDILAEKDQNEIFVEVKGTTSFDPNAIMMTSNEVELHYSKKGQTALAIVSSIKLKKGEIPEASGGSIEILIGWDIEEWSITPTAYRIERAPN